MKEGKREKKEGVGGKMWSQFHMPGLQEKGNGKQIYFPISIAQTKARVS